MIKEKLAAISILSATGSWIIDDYLKLVSAVVAIISGLIASWYYFESARLKRKERKRLE